MYWYDTFGLVTLTLTYSWHKLQYFIAIFNFLKKNFYFDIIAYNQEMGYY